MLIVGIIAGCAAVEPQVPAAAPTPTPAQDTGARLPQSVPLASDASPLPPPVQQLRSRWVPVRWAALAGFTQDEAALYFSPPPQLSPVLRHRLERLEAWPTRAAQQTFLLRFQELHAA